MKARGDVFWMQMNESIPCDLLSRFCKAWIVDNPKWRFVQSFLEIYFGKGLSRAEFLIFLWAVSDDEQDKLGEMLDEAAADLGEHFDAVQILATSCDESGTWTISRGAGNWNARQGMAHTFIKQEEASDQAKFIASELKQSD